MFGKAPMKIFPAELREVWPQKIADELGIETWKALLPSSAMENFSHAMMNLYEDAWFSSCSPPILLPDNLFELLLMIDAAKRASAYKVIASNPYYGFARQDRKDRPRVSIGSKLSADLLSAAGVDRVITMDCMPTRYRVSSMYPSTTFLDQHLRTLY